MRSSGIKNTLLTRSNWINRRYLIFSLLKYYDLLKHLHEEDDAPVNEHHDEAKPTTLTRKTIPPKDYYTVRNPTRPEKVWSALWTHFSSTSKKEHSNRKKSSQRNHYQVVLI